jgi:CRP/FNR family transcriptional regulator, cyclic AMP receptor protein
MWLVIAGWIAAALVFSTFFMKTMVRLRLAAIAGNLAFMTYALLGLAYGDFGRLYPIFVLHACLLPLNVVRLVQLRRVVAAARDAGGDQVVRALAPHLSAETHQAGEMLFRRGQAADRLYLIQQGTVAIPEAGVALWPGDLFGEVGLFAPHGRRTAGAVCSTDCRLLTLTGPELLELCHQDAQLAVSLARLLAGYVQAEPASQARRISSSPDHSTHPRRAGGPLCR